MDFMEIFTLVTGVIYMVLEIRQKNLMWVVGILTSLAAMWVFFRQGLYASFGLNTYYFVTAFIGLWHWRRDGEKVADGAIHLNRISWKVVAVSAAMMLVGTALLTWVMQMVENPMSLLDSSVTVLSAIATWWLVKTYIQQWWLWIIADSLSVVLCMSQGLWWMSLLYVAYVAAAVVGLRHWRKHGEYII